MHLGGVSRSRVEEVLKLHREGVKLNELVEKLKAKAKSLEMIRSRQNNSQRDARRCTVAATLTKGKTDNHNEEIEAIMPLFNDNKHLGPLVEENEETEDDTSSEEEDTKKNPCSHWEHLQVACIT